MTQELDYSKIVAEMMLQMGVREKAVSSTPSTIMGHGPGGLFSTPGLSKALFSAMILPRTGLQAQLPVRSTTETNPLYGIITGVTASSGSEPTGVCDDPPSVGVTKLCTHSFVFGRYSRQTRVFDLDRAGRIVNRGEFRDFNVFGNPLMGNNSGFSPSLPGGAGIGNAAINEVSKALFEFGVGWMRDFAKQLFTGNPTNNTAGGGYKEFYGLDSLINTGYRDVETGNLCPAADSIVRSFGNRDIKTNSAAIVREITYVYRNLQFLASHANLTPLKIKLVMPYGLFYELTDVWPIAYSTYRASGAVGSGSTLFINSDSEMLMRDGMRGDMEAQTGQYLLIDGQKVDVVIDEAIAQTQNAGGSFTAGIYFVPMTVLGGEPVTFMEHFDYEAPGGAVEMAQAFAPADSFYTTDNGRFLWHKKPPTNYCVQVMAKTEPRLLLLTPYLAARLTNVNYTPLMPERSWDTANASYFVDGGRQTGNNVNPSYLVVPG